MARAVSPARTGAAPEVFATRRPAFSKAITWARFIDTVPLLLTIAVTPSAGRPAITMADMPFRLGEISVTDTVKPVGAETGMFAVSSAFTCATVRATLVSLAEIRATCKLPSEPICVALKAWIDAAVPTTAKA